MIEIIPIASGSGANAVIVRTSSTCLLVDCGLPQKELMPRLRNAGISIMEVDAILLTHEHADHSKSIASVSKTFNIPVLMSADTFRAVTWSHIPKDCDSATIGDINVEMVRIPHDAADPKAFILQSLAGDLAAYVVDLGHVTDELVTALDGVRTLMIEANHDEDMLAAGPHHPRVKERCMGPNGHLSNAQVAEFLRDRAPNSIERLILGHISHVANDPHLALLTAIRACLNRGLAAKVEVA